MRKLPGIQNNAKLTDFGVLLEPKDALKPILSKAVSDALSEWITEIRSEQELVWVGLTPRRKALFMGPPGVGKTTLAHHLGARLKIRVIAVRPECIIDCWVGSSSRTLGTLFDLAANEQDPLILFFDEFDAIAGQRLSARTGADMHYNEMIDTLLQRIEGYKGFLIAATNFGEAIDQAIYRRFELQITLQNPGQPERRKILARYLAPYGLPPAPLDALAMSMENAMPALMRQFIEGLKRQIVIGPKVGWSMQKEAVVERVLEAVKPHPDLPLPRLWNQKAKDHAVRILPWPLPLAEDCPGGRAREDVDAVDDNVVQIGAAR